MARGPGGSLLAPILLAFVVGIVLYLYWGVSSQLADVQVDSRELKRNLAGARNERDNLQYRLNLLREDLDVALQKKDEMEGRAQEEAAKRQNADDRIAQLEEKVSVVEQDRRQLKMEIKDLQEHNSIVDDDIDQYRKDLSACEKETARLKSVCQSTETLQEQNSALQFSVQNLRTDKQELTSKVTELTKRVAELEERVKTCGQTQESLEERVWKDLERDQGNAPAVDLIKET